MMAVVLFQIFDSLTCRMDAQVPEDEEQRVFEKLAILEQELPELVRVYLLDGIALPDP